MNHDHYIPSDWYEDLAIFEDISRSKFKILDMRKPAQKKLDNPQRTCYVEHYHDRGPHD